MTALGVNVQIIEGQAIKKTTFPLNFRDVGINVRNLLRHNSVVATVNKRSICDKIGNVK